MSSIVLSASVRQNLLSLQSTADLLATTQNRLSTGKKVNSALDNPTNFFTAQSLDNRASDINNLLDGIGNGVQVLQAANTGITSLQKLVDTAKSIANQALQTTVGYSTKSNVSATIAGATANDLRGTTTYTSAIAISNVLLSRRRRWRAPRPRCDHAGRRLRCAGRHRRCGRRQRCRRPCSTLTLAGSSRCDDLAGRGAPDGRRHADRQRQDHHLQVRALPRQRRRFPAGSGVSGNIVTDGSGNSTVYFGTTAAPTATCRISPRQSTSPAASRSRSTPRVQRRAPLDRLRRSAIAAGILTLNTSTGADLSITGKADLLKALGLTTSVGSGNATRQAARTTRCDYAPATLIQDGSTLNVNGTTITLQERRGTGRRAQRPDRLGRQRQRRHRRQRQLDGLSADRHHCRYAERDRPGHRRADRNELERCRDCSRRVGPDRVVDRSQRHAEDLRPAPTADLVDHRHRQRALASLGLTGATGTGTSFTAARTAGAGGINGKTLTFTSFNGGTAVNVTFGDGTAGTVKTLDQLNTSLQANNLAATVDSTGKLTISTTNDYASSTLGSVAAGGAIGGTVTSALTFSTATAPVADPSAQAVRSNLVTQYNNILAQITTTVAGCVVQRRQPARRRHAEADLQRNRQVDPEHHGRQLQRGGSRSGEPDQRRRLHRQLRHQQGRCQPEHRQHLAAFAGVGLGFEPVDRADPSGLLEEPDQRAADRFVQPDAGRHQRGSGQQPGAVDPPVDRGVRAVAGQPVAAERAAAAPLSRGVAKHNDLGGGGNPAAFELSVPGFYGGSPAAYSRKRCPEKVEGGHRPRTLEKETTMPLRVRAEAV